MRAFIACVVCIVALAMAIFSPKLAGQDIISISGIGNVALIDSTTGTGTLLGPSGLASANAMAKDGSGQIWVAKDIQGSTMLFTLDTATGVATPVSLTPLNVLAMAFDASGVLYAIDATPGNDALHTIDPLTGSATLVAPNVGFADIKGMSFSPSGALFAWDSSAGLILIDPATGTSTDVSPGPAPAPTPYWSDDFDSYVPGTICPQNNCANSGPGAGGWEGWDLDPAQAGVISPTISRSAPNSLLVPSPGPARPVQAFNLNDPTGFPTSGVWTLRLWQRIDPGFQNAGLLWVHSDYMPPEGNGPHSNAIEIRFDPVTNTVQDDLRNHTPIPIAFNQWVEIVIDINLNNNTQTTTYNGVQLSTGVYSAIGSPTAIAALDIRSDVQPGPAVFRYDDMSLERQLNGLIDTLAFSPSGALFGARRDLYTVDPVTGAIGFAGTSGFGNVRGMEFLPTQTLTASFTSNPNPSNCGQSVTFDASGSTAGPGGPIVLYDWDFGDGTTDMTMAPMTTHTYAAMGNYVVTLSVLDGQNNFAMTSAPHSVALTQNSPPVADAGGPYVIIAGEDITLDASGTTDPDLPCGDGLTFEWDLNQDNQFGDVVGVNPFLDQSTISNFMLDSPVTSFISVRATDSSGQSSVASVSSVFKVAEETQTGPCFGVELTGRWMTEIEWMSSTDWRICLVNYRNSDWPVGGYCFTFGDDSGGMMITIPTGLVIPACEIRTLASGAGLLSGCSVSGSPHGNLPPVVGTSLPWNTSWATICLVDPGTGETVDEVRIGDPAGFHPDAPTASFRGVAPRPSSPGPWSISRIVGLDSNSGADWLLGTSGPTTTGARGTDPTLKDSVLINEIDTDPFDYVELFNSGGMAVEMQGWELRTIGAPGNGVPMTTIRPFPQSTMLGAGQYLVIGDGPTPPAEMPNGVLYVDLSTCGGDNIPLTGDQPIQLGLYDSLGRCIDLLRTAGDDDRLVSNRPRIPAYYSDFFGVAGRDLATAGDAAIGRIGVNDTDTGSDWQGVFIRSMGMPNSGFSGLPGSSDEVAVVLHDNEEGALLYEIAASPASQGAPYGILISLQATGGQGPLLGLGWDALANYVSLGTSPIFSGVLDNNGEAGFYLPLLLPPGFAEFELVFFVVDPQTGALQAHSGVINYRT